MHKIIIALAVSLHCLLLFAQDTQAIIIRELQEHDFEAIENLIMATFAHTYAMNTQEQLAGLKKYCNAIITEEKAIHQNREKYISLVAICDTKIIGFLSTELIAIPHELYGRIFVVDTFFQGKGIGTLLLKKCRALLPMVNRVVCMTNKKNRNVHKFYEYFGGKKVENPYWSKYLYTYVNSYDYIGYEFDQTAIMAFDAE